MKPPILQTAWHNRVFCPPGTPGMGDESFVLGVVSPDGTASFWLDFRVAQAPASSADAAFGEVGITWAPAGGAPGRTLRERLPTARTSVDPERAGVAIGECVFGEGHASGRVADGAGAVTWDLSWAPQAPYLPLGEQAAGGPPCGWLAALGAQGAASLQGRVEIWPRHGRHVQAEVIALAGWQAVQVHRWRGRGARRSLGLPTSWIWAAAAPSPEGRPGARLVAASLPESGARGAAPKLVACLWHGPRAWPLSRARPSAAAAKASLTAVAWAFTAEGPEASLLCRVDHPATAPAIEHLKDGSGQALERAVAHIGGLEVELRLPDGASERIRFDHAVYEHVARAGALWSEAS